MDQSCTKKKPIKRSEHIAALSRDHHAGLLFCWKIKEGLKCGIDPLRINQYVKYFWEGHLQEHFREEETLLFNKLDNDLTSQGKREHQVLSGWFMRIINNEVEHFKDYLSFTELLTNHIRFEERVLFPFIEEHLPKTDLEAIGAHLAKAHSVAFNDSYHDEFWIRQA
mgnify:CR=1 FL=1